jgi:Holliday junction resolvase RusA-like endonuclease
MEFFLPCIPPRATHHAKKIVNIRLRDGRSFAKLADKPELVSAREFWISLLRPHMPPAPIAPPVSLTLELTWPWRSSDPKRLRARFDRIPCEVKPDCTNAAKTIEDLLVGLGFIPGDEKVAELIVRKFIGNTPGLAVRIATVGPLWATEATKAPFILTGLTAP